MWPKQGSFTTEEGDRYTGGLESIGFIWDLYEGK